MPGFQTLVTKATSRSASLLRMFIKRPGTRKAGVVEHKNKRLYGPFLRIEKPKSHEGNADLIVKQRRIKEGVGQQGRMDAIYAANNPSLSTLQGFFDHNGNTGILFFSEEEPFSLDQSMAGDGDMARWRGKPDPGPDGKFNTDPRYVDIVLAGVLKKDNAQIVDQDLFDLALVAASMR